MIVAHGHFSRVFIARWIGSSLELGSHFNVEPGGVSALRAFHSGFLTSHQVAVLSYNHGSLDEPALNALNLHADVI
jgi:probable phosphoglycerate mutase